MAWDTGHLEQALYLQVQNYNAYAFSAAAQAAAEATTAATSKQTKTRRGYRGKNKGPAQTQTPSQKQVVITVDTSDDPRKLAWQPKLCQAALEALSDDMNRVDEFLDWLLPVAKELAFDATGCRIVQRLLDTHVETRLNALLSALEPHTLELLEHPSGNYVLNKAIEVMPDSAMSGVVQRIVSADCLEVARHRFGCRILERLLECCLPAMIYPISSILVQNVVDLATHEFGSFVVRCVIGRGTDQDRTDILAALLPKAASLAMTRSGSFTVQTMLQQGNREAQVAIASALIYSDEPCFLDLVSDCSGSFVIEEIKNLEGPSGDSLVQEVFRRLSSVTAEEKAAVFERKKQSTEVRVNSKGKDRRRPADPEALFARVAETFGIPGQTSA